MRKFCSLLLLTALCGTAAAHPVSMWKIEGDSNVVYLLGSIHLLRRDDHPLPGVIERAYEDAETIIMELDMDDLDPARIQSVTNRAGVLTDNTTLRDLMGASRYERAEALAAELDIPFDMLAKTEPWFAAITVEQLALMRIGFNPLYGIEMHVAMKATQDDKPVEGLETIEEQIAFLDGLSLEAQNELLMQTLSEGADLEALMDELIRAWRHGDTAYLEETIVDDMADYKELYEVIVVNRNKRWADSIADLLDDKDDYLIVVGTLHLVGDDGVPALLTERGIRTGQMNESL